MKILYHHRTLADGAEGIHITEMVGAFRELGHEVRVHGIAADPGHQHRHELAARVRRLLPAAGFELASVAVNVPEYIATRREIRKFRPDFIYTRHARYDVAALSAARILGVPTVLEMNCLFSDDRYHAFEPMTFGSLARSMEYRALRLATIVVAVSTPLAQDIQRLTNIRAIVLPNGANPQCFDRTRADPGQIRDRHRLHEGITIGWAGVIREWHGLELLLEAIAAVPRAQLLVIGDGPRRGEFERRSAALGVADRVIVTGRVPHDEMPDYLAAVDIGVVAHERTGVASPMKLLEYMAMGLPSVAPRLNNIVDVVEDGINALLFMPGDAISLTTAIRRLVNDADLRRFLGENARRTIVEDRNWQRNAEAVIGAFREAERSHHIRNQRCPGRVQL